MGLRWTESFDWTDATADIAPRKWGSTVWNGAAWSLRAGAGRTGNCMRLTSGALGQSPASTGELRIAGGWNQNVAIVGAAIRVSAWPPIGYVAPIFHLVEAGASDPGCALVLADDGRLRLAGNSMNFVDGGTYIGPQITPGQWYYVELLGKIGSGQPPGTVKLAVDGVVASQNTITASFGYLGGNLSLVKLGGYYGGAGLAVGLGEGESIEFDDVYIADNTLSQPFPIGPCTVDYLAPSGEGGSSQWTPSAGGSPNWEMVDDPASDGDATYVWSNGIGNRDLYTLPALPVQPMTIHGVASYVEARRDDVYTRRITGTIRSGGVIQDGTWTPTINSNYAFYPYFWNTDPATGGAWTFAAITDLEAGVKHA